MVDSQKCSDMSGEFWQPAFKSALLGFSDVECRVSKQVRGKKNLFVFSLYLVTQVTLSTHQQWTLYRILTPWCTTWVENDPSHWLCLMSLLVMHFISQYFMNPSTKLFFNHSRKRDFLWAVASQGLGFATDRLKSRMTYRLVWLKAVLLYSCSFFKSWTLQYSLLPHLGDLPCTTGGGKV